MESVLHNMGLPIGPSSDAEQCLTKLCPKVLFSGFKCQPTFSVLCVLLFLFPILVSYVFLLCAFISTEGAFLSVIIRTKATRTANREMNKVQMIRIVSGLGSFYQAVKA